MQLTAAQLVQPSKPMDSTLPTPAPDWSIIDDPILCPLCDYNLRGLSTPRCPECGYQFDWREVLDRARQRHEYLFEHHPEQNLRSFRQTLVGTLRPRAFWRSLHPTQPSSLKRLLLYWILTAIIASLPMLVPALPGILERYAQPFRFGPPPVILRQQIARQIAPLTYRAKWYWSVGWHVYVRPLLEESPIAILLTGGIAYLLWPIATFALLMIFQSTMRSGRIKPTHVLRCVIYSADPAVWIAPPLAISVVLAVLAQGKQLAPIEAISWVCLVLAPTLWLTMVHRLTVACRLYLRFQHAAATVLATQLILLLVILVVRAAFDAR